MVLNIHDDLAYRELGLMGSRQITAMLKMNPRNPECPDESQRIRWI
jgi:hypothetical protein